MSASDTIGSLAAVFETLQNGDAALQACKAGVMERESPPVLFLRYADGNVAAAAQRLANFWEERTLVFGKESILKPLEDCLTDQQKAWLASRNDQILPGVDKQGRKVLLGSYRGISNVSFADAISLGRFAVLYKIMLEQHRQTVNDSKGLVLLPVVEMNVNYDMRFVQRSEHVISNCFPFAFDHIRFLCIGNKSYMNNVVLPMVLDRYGKTKEPSVRAHVVSDAAHIQPYLADILEAHQVPTWLGGTWIQLELIKDNQSEVEKLGEALLEMDELVGSVLECADGISEEDLLTELHNLVDESSTNTDGELVLDVADSLRKQRELRLRETREVQAKVDLVFGVAASLLEESEYSSVSSLLKDSEADELLQGLWELSPPSAPLNTCTMTVDEDDAKPQGGATANKSAATLSRLVGQETSQPMQGVTSAVTDAGKQRYHEELHSKFRSALFLLSLVEDGVDGLRDSRMVGLICELVDLPYRTDEIDPVQADPSRETAETTIDRLAHRLADRVRGKDIGLSDNLDWLVQSALSLA